ncbi:MAG: hypothetical protein GY757_11430, partial [bacterium]|nr:hypothetical protein [bacterium]
RLYAGPLTVNEAVTPAGKPFKLLNFPYFLVSKIHLYLEWFTRHGEENVC